MWKRGIMAMKMELRTTWDEKMENRNISNWMRLNLPSINSVSVTCCPQLLIHCVKSQYVLKLLLHHRDTIGKYQSNFNTKESVSKQVYMYEFD